MTPGEKRHALQRIAAKKAAIEAKKAERVAAELNFTTTIEVRAQEAERNGEWSVAAEHWCVAAGRHVGLFSPESERRAYCRERAAAARARIRMEADTLPTLPPSHEDDAS